MKTPKVRLYIRVKRANGTYAFLDPAWNKNHTLRSGCALVEKRPETYQDWTYYLRYMRGSKRVWEAVGAEPDAAVTALHNKEHDLKGEALHRPTDPTPSGPSLPPDLTVSQTIEKYLSDIRRFRSAKTIAACENILGRFEKTFGTRPLSTITREDMLDHMEALLKGEPGRGDEINSLPKRKLAPRTVYNHIMRIKGFLKSQGIAALLKSEDIPDYDEPEVEAYNTDQLQTLFQAAQPEERLLFEFFLATGFRDQEVRFATWRNVDLNGKVISVKSKPELGFRPKDKEERSVPVPDALIEALAERKGTAKSMFVFPGPNGAPDGHFLRRLQRLAFRAGLNCGECLNTKGQCCRDHAACGSWGLHKFRKTFATMHSEAGVPVTTIQRWLGHSDLATTLRYLAIADLRSERTRQQVNATFASLSGSGLATLAAPPRPEEPTSAGVLVPQDLGTPESQFKTISNKFSSLSP